MADNNTAQIPNAPHWLNHSAVLVRVDRLAEDSAWIMNQCVTVDASDKQNPTMQNKSGNMNILTIQRMVVRGVVAVTRPYGTKTVNLPQEAGKLLDSDAQYIVSQLDLLHAPMTIVEQADFLPAANGQSVALSAQESTPLLSS